MAASELDKQQPLKLTRRRFPKRDGGYTIRSVAADRAQRGLLLEELAFDLEKIEARKVHARLQGKRIVLPQAMRLELLNGGFPSITCWGREPCPIRPGMEYRLSGDNYCLRFTEVRRNRKGHHRCIYTLRDFRPLTLETKPTDTYGRRKDKRSWKPEEEHGYSHSADVLDAGDVLGPIHQSKITERAELERVQGDELAQARRERYDLDLRLQKVIDTAEREGIDISSPRRVIERQLTKIERRLHQGKAA